MGIRQRQIKNMTFRNGADLWAAIGTLQENEIVHITGDGLSGSVDGGKLSISNGSGQFSVIGQIDLTAFEPAAPAFLDRYINTATGISLVTAQAVTATTVCMWNGVDWSALVPWTGMVVYDVSSSAHIHFDGTAWVRTPSASTIHSAYHGTWIADSTSVTAGSDIDLGNLVSTHGSGSGITINAASDTFALAPGKYQIILSASPANGGGVGPFSFQLMDAGGTFYGNGAQAIPSNTISGQSTSTLMAIVDPIVSTTYSFRVTSGTGQVLGGVAGTGGSASGLMIVQLPTKNWT